MFFNIVANYVYRFADVGWICRPSFSGGNLHYYFGEDILYFLILVTEIEIQVVAFVDILLSIAIGKEVE
jgi:hypothetical protein